jgi:hypothetical protein
VYNDIHFDCTRTGSHKNASLLLQHGIFLPARKYFNAKVAVFLTFVGSGFFHDYVWTVTFYHQHHRYDENGHCHGCFVPTIGKVTAFFLYTGMIMMLERPLSRLAPFQWMSKNLPTFIIATLLVLVHVPVAHW